MFKIYYILTLCKNRSYKKYALMEIQFKLRNLRCKSNSNTVNNCFTLFAK